MQVCCKVLLMEDFLDGPRIYGHVVAISSCSEGRETWFPVQKSTLGTDRDAILQRSKGQRGRTIT